MQVVETIKLRIADLEGPQRLLADACIHASRELWNWLVSLDRPTFDARRELWSACFEQAEAEHEADKPEGKAAIQDRAFALFTERKATLPPFQTPSLKSPVPTFRAWAADRPALVLSLKRIERGKAMSCLHNVVKRYKDAFKSAQGFTRSGERRKGGKTGVPVFLARRETDRHASISFQKQKTEKDKASDPSGSGTGKALTRRMIDWANHRVFITTAFGWLLWRDAGKRLKEALEHRAETDRVRLVRDAGKWFVVFDVTYNVEVDAANAPTTAIGIDRGVTHPLATSNGELLGEHLLKQLRRLERRKKHLQRAQSRKLYAAAKADGALTETGAIRKGARIRRSKRALRLLTVMGKHAAKIARVRDTWAAQTAAGIASTHGVVVIERLKVRNMTRSAKGDAENPGTGVRAKSGLNRAILNIGWTGFRNRLDHALTRRGGHLIEVNPAYTSQTCAQCGVVDPKSRHRTDFRCVACGHEAHADINAARVILSRGIGAAPELIGAAKEQQVGRRTPDPAGETQSMRVERGIGTPSTCDERRNHADAREPVAMGETPGLSRKKQATDWNAVVTVSVSAPLISQSSPEGFAQRDEKSPVPSRVTRARPQ